jgi:hypothetical protein
MRGSAASLAVLGQVGKLVSGAEVMGQAMPTKGNF